MFYFTAGSLQAYFDLKQLNETIDTSESSAQPVNHRIVNKFLDLIKVIDVLQINDDAKRITVFDGLKQAYFIIDSDNSVYNNERKLRNGNVLIIHSITIGTINTAVTFYGGQGSDYSLESETAVTNRDNRIIFATDFQIIGIDSDQSEKKNQSEFCLTERSNQAGKSVIKWIFNAF